MVIPVNRSMLLKALKAFTEDALSDLILPTRIQSKDEEQQYRAPDVYMMRLPDSKQATKKAPYILHQLITAADKQVERYTLESVAVVRSIFCAYSEDEEEGGMMLLEMAERLRIKLLRECVIDNRFELDLQEGVEFMAYPDDTAPYYAGEMITTWKMPPVEREVTKVLWGET